MPRSSGRDILKNNRVLISSSYYLFKLFFLLYQCVKTNFLFCFDSVVYLGELADEM